MKRAIVIVASLWLLVLGGVGQALAACPCEKLRQPDALFYISRGDSYFLQREKPEMAQKAAHDYTRALQMAPNNANAAWRLARALYYVAKNAPDDELETLYQRAIKASKLAITQDPNCAPCHYFLAVSLCMYGKARGIMESLDMVDPVMEQLNRVIQLNPRYDHGGAYRILGRIYFELPALFGGDNDRAEENLLMAYKLAPNDNRTHLYLAELYLDEGEKDKARQFLDRALAAPGSPGMEQENQECKKKARKILANLE